MYNFGGIYYEMKSEAIVYMVSGIVFLILSRFWNMDKRNIKEAILGCICIVLTICSIIYYVHIINNPIISTHEGYFVSEYRVNKHILKKEYCFSNGNERKPVFYLDVLTKKKIYPEDFNSNQKYRIFYEEKSNVIIKIEELA